MPYPMQQRRPGPPADQHARTRSALAERRKRPPALQEPARRAFAGSPRPEKQAGERLRVVFWVTERRPPFASRYEAAVRGMRADLVQVVEVRELAPAAEMGGGMKFDSTLRGEELAQLARRLEALRAEGKACHRCPRILGPGGACEEHGRTSPPRMRGAVRRRPRLVLAREDR